jgi:hypothetical protein
MRMAPSQHLFVDWTRHTARRQLEMLPSSTLERETGFNAPSTKHQVEFVYRMQEADRSV